MASEDMSGLRKKYAMTLYNSYRSALEHVHLPHTTAIIEVYLEGRMATGDKTEMIKQELSHLEGYLCIGPFDWLRQKISPDHGVSEARKMIERSRDEIHGIESSLQLNPDRLRLPRESAAIPLAPQDIDWSYLQIIDNIRYAEEKVQGRIKDTPQRSHAGLDNLTLRFEKHVTLLSKSK